MLLSVLVFRRDQACDPKFAQFVFNGCGSEFAIKISQSVP
jgi:hypothetical protein